MGGSRRYLLCGRAYDRRRRQGRQSAAEHAIGGDRRIAREPVSVGQTLRQHRRLHPHRERLRRHRDRLAVSLGGRTLRWPHAAGFPQERFIRSG